MGHGVAIRGVQISNMASLREGGHGYPQAGGERRRDLFTQVFKHNFFHADMHPGNIFVLIDNPAQPKYAAVDFGIVGTLDPRDQYYLAAELPCGVRPRLSQGGHAAPGVGWVPEGSRVDEMESAIRTVCEPIFNKPLEGNFLRHGVAAAVRDIAALQRVDPAAAHPVCRRRCSTSKGLGRDLYPDLDIFKTAGPIMREWVREKMSGRAILENARAQLPEILTSLQTLAPLVRSAVQRAQDGRLRLAVEAPEINALRSEIRRTNRRRDKVTIAAVLLLGGLVWMALGHEPAWAGWALSAVGCRMVVRIAAPLRIPR
jgi:ubiquinone biosynthesis protein